VYKRQVARAAENVRSLVARLTGDGAPA